MLFDFYFEMRPSQIWYSLAIGDDGGNRQASSNLFFVYLIVEWSKHDNRWDSLNGRSYQYRLNGIPFIQLAKK